MIEKYNLIKYLCVPLVYLLIVQIRRGYVFRVNTIPILSIRLSRVKAIFYGLGISLFLIGALFEITTGISRKKGVSSDPDVFFLLDYTASMRTQDGDGGKSRVNQAIDKIISSVRYLKVNNVGLSIFSENQYQLIPLTTDKEFFVQHLLSLQKNVVPSGGGNIQVALKEISLREKRNNNLNVVIISDFEKVKISKSILDNFINEFRVLAIGEGTVSGGRVPKAIKNKYQKTRYLKKSGKTVFSYFDNKNFSIVERRVLSPGNYYDFINTEIKKTMKNATESEWYAFGANSYGHFFAFFGICFIFLSRLLWDHRALGVIFIINLFGLSGYSQVNNLESKILQGDASKYDFLLFGNALITSKEYDAAIIIYGEQLNNLANIEKVNLGTIHFLNQDFRNGALLYLEYLESNNLGESEYENVRLNLLKLFNGRGKGGGKGKAEGKNRPTGKGKSQPSSGSNRANDNRGSSGMTNNEVLQKIQSDDMVNQGEYIKKKIKAGKKNSEVRW